MTEGLKISKLDAARRQLETAILLYFNEADPVSIHTLTAAAHEILRDLSLHIDSPMLLERSFEHLPEELRNKIHNAMRQPQNFFKHADRDPQESFEFVPGMTEWILVDGMGKYFELTGERTLILRTYDAWFGARHSEFSKHIPLDAPIQKARKEVRTMSRMEFFSYCMVGGAALVGVTPNPVIRADG
jgi:hypothetical protein